MPTAERNPRLAIDVIGTGKIGLMHAGLLAGRVRGARLAAVCDLDRARAELTAEKLGARVADSPRELIERYETSYVRQLEAFGPRSRQAEGAPGGR